MDDYYSILGVAETASADEIKRAYRKLAMEYHPDKNQGNSAAEEKFKKINEAYSAIGDDQNRARYDQTRKFGGNPFGDQGNPFQNHGFNFGFGSGNIDDIINQFFHQHGFGHAARQARNRDLNFNLHLTLEEAFTGKQTPVQFNVNGQDYNLHITIPAGIENGTRIRYQGHGDRSIPNVPPGDLYIQIQVVDHPIFRRQGPNLYCNVEVDAINAILGCERELTCIDGQRVKLTIPPGTQPDSQLKLKERGMPTRASGHPRGDCYATVKITVPRDLTESDKQLLRAVAHKISS